jgi:hypothetical protein
LPANAGENRANWDLRYDAPHALAHSFEINANPGLTPASPEGPVALPGTYTLKLTVDGKTYTQSATVKPDPHSPTTAAALKAQHDLQMRIVQGLNASYEGHTQALALAKALRGAIPAGSAPELTDVGTQATALAARIDSIFGLDAARGRGRRGGQAPPTFQGLNGAFAAQLNAQDLGDNAPTAATLAQFKSTCTELATVAATWQRLLSSDLSALNTTLKQRGRPAIAAATEALKLPSCA